MIVVQDVGELAYGGAVTGLQYWDDKRLAKGTITKKDFHKQASFWGYVVPGATCLIMNAVGAARKQEAWTERITHGFIYGFPSFMKNLITTLTEEETAVKGGGGAAESTAVLEARRLLEAARKEQPLGARVGAPGRVGVEI